MGMDGLGGLLDLLVGGIQASVADVLAHVAGEDEGVLKHDPHLPAQGGQGHVAHVMPVHANAALGHVVETRKKVDDGGLAGTRGPHQGDRAACRHMEVHQVEDVAASGLVLEYHVVEVHPALDRRQLYGPRAVLDLRVDIQGLEDAFQVGRAGDQLVVEVADVDDGVPEVVGIANEGD